MQSSPKTDAYAVYFSKEATNSNIQDNIITTSSDSIYFNSSSANSITNNNITSSDSIGIYFYEHSGSNIISHNIITTNGYYDAVSLMGNCDSNIVSDNILRSNLYGLGISFDYSNFNRITGNDIVSYDGIVCYHSDSATISNNNITTSSQGIRFYDCFNDTLTGNRMNTTEDAIFIYSKNMSHYNHTIDTTNTEHGDPIYYYFAVSSSTIENKNLGQLLIINSTNINVQNVTLDKGGIILDSVTNSKITNSKISSRSHGIYAININSNIISNNVIATDGFLRRSIYLESSKMNTLSDNVILYAGPIGVSINLKDSDLNTLSSNNILSTGSNSIGIDIINSKGNTISGGSIISPQGYDYVLVNSSSENHFIGTNFTSTRSIVFDENSFFDYNNLTENNISLKTYVSVFANMTRTLIKWSTREMKWNDTNRSGSGLIATYDIMGLRSNTYYNIYNTSRGTQTNPYTLSTDSDGNLPSFTIALKDNTEIKVVDKPPIITINSPEDNTLIIGNTTHFNVTTDENATCRYSYFIERSMSYPSYTSYYSVNLCGSEYCVSPSPSRATRGGGGSSYKLMDITGTTQHFQGVQFFWTFAEDKNFLSVNCTDYEGNSNTSSVSVILRNKPLTIDLLMPDNNAFYYNQAIKIYLGLTTNYSVDKIILNITRPDNTTEIFTENDFSEHLGAKQFLKLINLSYDGLTQTGNYTMRLYVNDTQGNSDTATRTFRVFNRKSHSINVSNDRQSYIYYTNHDTGETIAHLNFGLQGYSNITLPDTALDLQFYNQIYTFGVFISSLNLNDETHIEEKYVNESNLSISPRYIPKESYAFNILNASRINKTFKVEFFIEEPEMMHSSKIAIFKAPYNFTTGAVDYSTAIYYSANNPDYPLYYDDAVGYAWIYVKDFSVFALLEDKATSEICADSIDNDYDGQIDEGCATGGSGSSSSSSGGGSKSAPIIKRECENNNSCTSTQICKSYKCINLACSSCEYIEDHSCKKYQCCKDSECSSGEQCKDHSCMKIVEETAIYITEEQILADNAIDSARKAISGATGRKDTKDAEEFLSKAIAARNNNDYANAKALAEKSRLTLENAPLIPGKAIEATAERTDLLLVALVAILIVLIIMVLFPKKK